MTAILEKAKNHCIHFLEHSRCAKMPYHNLQHTRDVYRYVQMIGVYEGLTELDLEILKLAALFHDTGLAEMYQNHEDISSENATIFLESNGYPKLHLTKVIDCIQATRLPQDPKSHLERIICDADLFHLSSTDYFVKNKLLREEWAQFLDKEYTESEWLELNYKFLDHHHYHTDYCHHILKAGKLINRSLLVSKKMS